MDYSNRSLKIQEINDKVLDQILRFEFDLEISYEQQIEILHQKISELLNDIEDPTKLKLLFSHHICSTILGLMNKE